MSDLQPVPPVGGLKVQVMSALRWSAIAKFGGQIINWSITLIVMRLLAPSDYGLVAMMGLVLTFLSMLGELGFGSSIVQAKELQTSEIRQTIGAALLVNTAICALLAVAAPAVASFYEEPRIVDMLRVSALGFVANAWLPVYSGLLQREMRFKTVARIDVVCTAFVNFVTLGFAFAGYGAWALVLSGFLGGFLRLALLLHSASRLYWPAFRFSGTRRLWSFGGNILVSRIVWYWVSQADVLIAAKMLGTEALGFYSIAVHLASLPMSRASGLVNSVAFAAFARIQHDRRAVAANTRLAVRLMAFTTFPVLWGIGAVAPELIELVIGSRWEPSILPLTLIALTIPFRMIGSIVSTTIMSLGRVDIATVTTIIGACILIPLLFGGAYHGIVGLSLAWVVATPLMFLLNVFRALPILGVSLRDLWSEIWRPMLAAAVMLLIVEAVRTVALGWPGVVRLATLITVGALAYGLSTLVVNRKASMEALALLFPGRFGHWQRAAAS